jgi:hypothetical protein
VEKSDTATTTRREPIRARATSNAWRRPTSAVEWRGAALASSPATRPATCFARLPGSGLAADFRAGKRVTWRACSGNANKTFDPAIGGPFSGCNFIGVPGRASHAWPGTALTRRPNQRRSAGSGATWMPGCLADDRQASQTPWGVPKVGHIARNHSDRMGRTCDPQRRKSLICRGLDSR